MRIRVAVLGLALTLLSLLGAGCCCFSASEVLPPTDQEAIDAARRFIQAHAEEIATGGVFYATRAEVREGEIELGAIGGPHVDLDQDVDYGHDEFF